MTAVKAKRMNMSQAIAMALHHAMEIDTSVVVL